MFNRIVSFLISFWMAISSLFIGGAPADKLRLVVPEDWELCIGDSRTVECVFADKIKNRRLEWSTDPESVASVDKWGRVTALSVGKATVTAKGDGFSDSVELNVVETPTMLENRKTAKVDFGGESVDEVENLQKLVSRYPAGSPEIPEAVSAITDYSAYQTAVTADGAVWKITDYGVLRTYKNAPTERDIEQRFMGDRYFYSSDTTNGKVLAIVADGANGIWTVMEQGVTHIGMIKASGAEKASYMSRLTQERVSRFGFVDESYNFGNGWMRTWSDNDGLWTSMYGAGELMRYASLKENGLASQKELEEAKAAAYSSAEAVLLLYYISMRSGTTDAYIRMQQPEVVPGTHYDRWLSANALEKGGDPSFIIPSQSPADYFSKANASYTWLSNASLFDNKNSYYPVTESDWSDPTQNPDTEYEKQTRLLEGYPARTFALKSDGFTLHDNIYWSVNSDGTATGVSDKPADATGYLLNNENLRGVKVDASAKVPERLWSDLLGDEIKPEDIIYKTDTSADELVGHMFIFKLIYDIIAPEDPEIKGLLVNAIDNLAQHLSDNSYMLCDATGQPSTWSNFGRTLFNTGSSVAESSLHGLVLLDVFKTAAYITGYEKWENEYKMAALDPAYEYAKVAAQHYERMMVAMKYTVGDATIHLLGNVVGALDRTRLVRTVYRFIVNYSSEEMAMLAFYSMFQLENDEEILKYYRQAIDDWWISMRYSENPLWYYVYQLAYPDKKINDAYGNNIAETAAWSLSRHPCETVMYKSSNKNRDDIADVNLRDYGLGFNEALSYDVRTSGRLPELGEDSSVIDIIGIVLKLKDLDWAVAPPDERVLYKYNTSSYHLEGWHLTYCMQGSTTYTLPYWMGVYHGIMK